MPDMSAVIYARYSSDRQSESSIDDQVRICRKRAEAGGWAVSRVFADNEVSGAVPVNLRPGGRELLTASIQVLIVEGLDRLTRDMGEQERILKRLEFAGVRIIGVSDGYDTQMAGRVIHRGMRGIINEVYLEDLRHKTHRGLSGRASLGLCAGGVPYGYRTIDAQGGKALEVIEDQAEWVRWIYAEFAAGASYKGLAAELNRLGVTAPRGNGWAVSTLYGSPAKGTGILNNELYIGRYTWNRSRWQKDPDTGVRKRIERPPHEWQVMELPELRILTPGQWQAAKERQQRGQIDGGTRGRARAPQHLLSGILRCGSCGGPMVSVNSASYGCANRTNRGTCDMRYTANRDTAEQRILKTVRDDLLSPEAVALLQTEVRRISKERRQEDRSEQRRVELEREIGNLTEAIATLGMSEPLQQRYRKAQAELQGLGMTTVIQADIIPDLLNRYRKAIDDLRDIPQAKEVLRTILGVVPVSYDGTGLVAEVGSQGLIALASIGMVAGTCYPSYRLPLY